MSWRRRRPSGSTRRGRLSLPRRLREELGIEPGDTLFVEGGEGQATLRLAKAENPFDVLTEQALREHRAGRSKSARAFAAELGISLDED